MPVSELLWSFNLSLIGKKYNLFYYISKSVLCAVNTHKKQHGYSMYMYIPSQCHIVDQL